MSVDCLAPYGHPVMHCPQAMQSAKWIPWYVAP
jgi:hypothetical protein